MKRAIVLSIGFILLLGCASNRSTGGQAKGTLTYKGKPVNGAMLRFYPGGKKGNDFTVPVSQEGTFNAFDIPPGEYKIVVEAPEIHKMTVPPGMDEETKRKFEQAHSQDIPTIPYPKKYKNLQTSDLNCTITQGKKQDLPLELKD